MRDAISLVGLAVVCLTLIEITALIKNIDGAILSMIVGAISSLVTGVLSYAYGRKVERKVREYA